MNKELYADIAIIGGSTGGCAAALAAAAMGKKVIMTEETKWIGGQLTSQAVPPDEHYMIEKYGCTANYRKFRNEVRNYYMRNFPLSYEGSSARYFNPGNANVSRISHEPKVALAVLEQMLAPYTHSGRITVLTEHVPVKAETNGDNISSVTIMNRNTGDKIILNAQYFLDATECGDLLPLAGVEYVTGAESQTETGEPHALTAGSQPMDMQAITHCFAVDYFEGENHIIDKPEDYDFWRKYKPDFWPDRFLSFSGVRPNTLEPVVYDFLPHGEGLSYWKGFSLFTYRRIIDKTNFKPGTFDSDITIINWPQNDYFIGPIIDVPEEERKRHLRGARQLSLSLLYWLQTEAPRPDGGTGYPGLRLRKDVLGTDDGLAMAPYIRESRRIKAEFTILEQHVSRDYNPDGLAKRFYDSVGIGLYSIDLHPSTGNRNYIHFSICPFQIPLGSLIPVRVNNLLPACKNIGTTHISNGCYRLHPVEWNIGEASGYLAAFSIDKRVAPRQVRDNKELLEEFQHQLDQHGIELEWPVIR